MSSCCYQLTGFSFVEFLEKDEFEIIRRLLTSDNDARFILAKDFIMTLGISDTRVIFLIVFWLYTYRICYHYCIMKLFLTVYKILSYHICSDYTYTHTQCRFTAFCPRLPGWACTRTDIHPLTPENFRM